MTGDPVVSVPADLDGEDRVIGPFGFRALAWLSVAAAGAAFAVSAAERHRAAAQLGVPLVLAGVVGAWWRPGGLPPLSWLRAVSAYVRRSPRTPTPTATVTPPRRPRAARAVAATVCLVLLPVLTWQLGTHLRAHRAPVTPAGWDDCGC
jgi:hypothetical protein